MTLGTILLIGAVPTWPHSSKWGYGPSGLLGLSSSSCSWRWAASSDLVAR